MPSVKLLRDFDDSFATASRSTSCRSHPHTLGVSVPFIGSETVASCALAPYGLRTKFTAIHRDMYVPRDTELIASVRARAAWLWSQRRGVVAGRSASALHGAKWVDAKRPAEIIYDNRHPPATIRTWSDSIESDEVAVIDGMQ